MHQNCGDTPDATQRNGFVKTFSRCSVLPDGLREYPKDRAKHQDSTGQAELARDLQVIAMGVVNEESEESSLNGWINHGKATQSRSQKRMMPNQPESIAPD